MADHPGDSAGNDREELRRKLRDSKEYREEYATTALIENLSTQVQVLRRQRGLTQGELAQRVGTKQPRISNLEMPRMDNAVPNWEVDTLNRVAQALGTRLKISFESYSTLLDELDSVTSESMRRREIEDDPLLNPRPPVPEPDAEAPERTRWMQEQMIPWLWDDSLDVETLIELLQGIQMPAVGHDEASSTWLLRGIPKDVSPAIRDYMERQLAERLAVLLGEEPDVNPVVSSRADEFLINLYSTCAGLTRGAFLFEPLWRTYKRLRSSKLSGPVRDALQAALIANQVGDLAMREIWEPMIKKGRHSLLRGGSITGYQGLVARRKNGKPDYDRLFWALTDISNQWQGTDADRRAFRRMIEVFPDQVKLAINVLSGKVELSDWARDLFPKLYPSDGGIKAICGETTIEAEWAVDSRPRLVVTGPSSKYSDNLDSPAIRKKSFLANLASTYLSNRRTESVDERLIQGAFFASALRPQLTA